MDNDDIGQEEYITRIAQDLCDNYCLPEDAKFKLVSIYFSMRENDIPEADAEGNLENIAKMTDNYPSKDRLEVIKEMDDSMPKLDDKHLKKFLQDEKSDGKSFFRLSLAGLRARISRNLPEHKELMKERYTYPSSRRVDREGDEMSPGQEGAYSRYYEG